MIKTYKPKSREFLAVQWDGTNEWELRELHAHKDNIRSLRIGDWIVFDVYEQVTGVVTKDDFERNYEED